MKLYHYSHEPLTLDRWKENDEHYFEGNIKPRGLWVSADEYEQCWPEWCWSEDFGINNLANRHEVSIATERVVLLETPDAVLDFGNQYMRRGVLRHRESTMFLDWKRITQEWDGLVIVPYQFSLRLDMNAEWYYSWDVASGCIWRKRSILSIERTDDNPWHPNKYKGELYQT